MSEETVPASYLDRTEFKNFFLCFGFPKSGTTYLQRTLNLHPEISCPSEQALGALRENLARVFEAYNRQLEIVDRRTGGQGAPAIAEGTGALLFRDMVLRLSHEWSGRSTIHGFNDNGVTLRYPFYRQLFPEARMIFLLRNPVDRALSAWIHNKRLMEAEPENAANHAGALMGHEHDPLPFVEALTQRTLPATLQVLDWGRQDPRFRAVLYEDLVEDPATAFGDLFGFLGARTEPEALAVILEKSSKSAMRAASRFPDFFTEDGAKHGLIPETDRRRILVHARASLHQAGHDLARMFAE